MKKALLKFLIYILAVGVVSCTSYCCGKYGTAYVYGKINEKLMADALEEYGGCIGFSTLDKYDSESFRAVKTDVVESYTADYADCNSRILYSKLETDEEKLAYRAVEYACDNSFTYIFFDKSIFGDDIDYKKILHFFVLDSPTAEQNLSYAVSGEPGSYMSASYAYEDSKGRKATVRQEGYLLHVETFADRGYEKYSAAYDKAQRIVADMPDGLTDMEKARYLYKYLCVNTTYKDYGEELKTEQLYDALILGETVCDGFTNALSLLYNLAGIPCLEKLYLADEDDAAGHTWDCFLVDGVWYNADATFNDSLEEGIALEEVLEGFAFSDKYQRHIPEYADVMPQCTGDTLFAGAEYYGKNTDTYELLGAVIQSWRDSKTRIGCILTDYMTGEELEVLREAMRNEERIYDVDTYYFYYMEYVDFDALIFVDSTGY